MKRITWGRMEARLFTAVLSTRGREPVYYLAFGNLVIAWRRKP